MGPKKSGMDSRVIQDVNGEVGGSEEERGVKNWLLNGLGVE